MNSVAYELSADLLARMRETRALSSNDPRDKIDIEQDIASYKRQRSPAKEERRLVEQALSAVAKTRRLMEQVVKSEAFQLIGTRPDLTEQPDWDCIRISADALTALSKQLELALKRFDRVNSELIFPSTGALEELAFNMMMTHARSLGTAPPTSQKQSSQNPGFVELIRLAAFEADPNLIPNDRRSEKKIQSAIAAAVTSYAKVKAMDPSAWAENWPA